MTDETASPQVEPEITSDDKLWGALSYFFIIAIIMLLTEEKKNRPFVKYHAVQSIAFSVVLTVASIVLGIIPVVQCFTPLLWLVLIWPAVGAYGGKYVVVPVVSDFIRKQGWV